MQIVEPLLGTRAEIHVTAEPVISAQTEAAVLHEIARLEKIFTVFDSSSDLNHLRRTGATNVPELNAVVRLASTWHECSGGAFDPAVQRLMALWDEAESCVQVPSSDELAHAVAAAVPDHGFLNLNAIAKGWIAQAAVDTVEVGDGCGVQAVWLSLGGDVVHRGVGSLTVRIEDPHRPYDNAAPIASAEISNEALATSGGARRYWTIDGQTFSKVLDPRTARPVDHVASATVIAADAATADVLATIATVVDTETTLKLVDQAGAHCLLVHADKSRTASSGRLGGL